MRGVDWTNTLFIVGYHVALLVGLPFYFVFSPPGWGLVAVAAVLLLLTEIGIGAAYHRFYSHRCYALSRPAELVLLFLATLAVQGSALRWSFDHRRHHAFVDTDGDPYAVTKGFWHAHVLWLFKKDIPIDGRWVRDLEANPLVRFQHRWYGWLSIGSNAALCLAVGIAASDLLGSFVLVWWTRLALSHHLTWSINSLAHYWGARTYSREHSAVDNFLIAFLTVGEGYHNFHHTFPRDYRNGVRWYHFDPTKWTIWLLSRVGLAGKLRRTDEFRIKRCLVRKDRSLLLEHVQQTARTVRADLEPRIERLSASLVETMNRLSELREDVRRSGRERRGELKRELRRMRQAARRELREWNRLCSLVLAQPRSA